MTKKTFLNQLIFGGGPINTRSGIVKVTVYDTISLQDRYKIATRSTYIRSQQHPKDAVQFVRF